MSAVLYRLRGDPRNRLWVGLTVKGREVRAGLNARNPGLKLFTGLWYGHDPLDHTGYGKIIDLPRLGRAAVPVGRIGRYSSPRLKARLGYQGRAITTAQLKDMATIKKGRK
ncbi:hypothetical protein KIKIMORA_00990 [Brevundimonas phage vB_BpoS-Kikimora]|uniref:Uncharacterized protein n=1 Tax=Brevundimonas phage vB_BpoS-Kikimora TaxID=2948601 RepID=A0A9E7MSF6_9CAUD|nr:hypothetical protein KIKIMORA_00990 [Brevundimonas phage vB_BpoS-Kikimora]